MVHPPADGIFAAALLAWPIGKLIRMLMTMLGVTNPMYLGILSPLIAFVLVYFAAFGAGTYYLLRLMAKPPERHEAEPPKMPQRAAGITPASGVSAPLPVAE